MRKVLSKAKSILGYEEWKLQELKDYANKHGPYFSGCVLSFKSHDTVFIKRGKYFSTSFDENKGTHYDDILNESRSSLPPAPGYVVPA